MARRTPRPKRPRLNSAPKRVARAKTPAKTRSAVNTPGTAKRATPATTAGGTTPRRATRPARVRPAQKSAPQRKAGGSASEDLVRVYLRDIGRISMLTDEEFAHMAERIDRLREGDDAAALQEAYQELVAANLRLVVSIAKRYTNCGIPLMDLIQVGNMGLMKAVEGFDFSRGCRLSTYASKWIHASITRYISNQVRTIRVPVNVIPMMNRLDRAAREYTLRSGNQPTVDELAEFTGMRPDQVRDLLEVPQHSMSLDYPIRGTDSDVTLTEVVEDPNANTSLQQVERDLFHRQLAEAIDTALDPREQQVLRMRYGLDGEEERTQSEIGELLQVSRQRISQIESRALRRLRAHDKDHVLKSYVN